MDVKSITLAVIDMQKLFLTEKKSPWKDNKLLSVVPNIKKLISWIGPQNVIFTRFVPPKNWENEPGSWKTYYRLNYDVTLEILGKDSTKIIDEFQQYVSDSAEVAARKRSASILRSGNFLSKLKERAHTRFLVFVGVETDYCVLSSVLDAIHLGYHVIVVIDACASSKKNGQINAIGIFERFPEQLWITTTNDFIKYLDDYNKPIN